MKYSVLIPSRNEEGNIFPLLKEFSKIEPKPSEIIFIENGSTDRTYEKLKEAKKFFKNINIVITRSKPGFGYAIKRGLQIFSYDYVITMDCDLSHHPSEIPKILNELKDYDIVIGSRFIPGGELEKRSRRFLTYVYSLVAKLVFGSKINDFSSGYRGYNGKKISTLKIESTGFEINPEILSKGLIKGFKVKEVSIKYLPRFWGLSKLSYKREMFKYGLILLKTLKWKLKL